jgi:hypothetical protein
MALGGPSNRIGIARLALCVFAFFAVMRDHRRAALAAAVALQFTYLIWADRVSWPVLTAILLLALLAFALHPDGAVLPGAWWLAVPAMTAALWAPALLQSGHAYLFYYSRAVFLSIVVLCALATLLDSRAAFAGVGLLGTECLAGSVVLHWAGDNPTGQVFHAFSVSWWSVVTGVAVVGLLVGGHLAARSRARP